MKRIIIHLNNLNLGRIGNATAALQVLKDLWGDSDTSIALQIEANSSSKIAKAASLASDLGLGYTTESLDP